MFLLRTADYTDYTDYTDLCYTDKNPCNSCNSLFKYKIIVFIYLTIHY